MAFMDKIGDIAKSAGDMAKNATEKAGDLIEVKKLESKINSQNEQIVKLQTEIGAIYWNKFLAGEAIDPAASEICGRIQQSYNEIETLKNSIAEIKDDKPSNQEVNSQPAVKFCTNCGNQLSEDLKFCPNCGNKQE